MNFTDKKKMALFITIAIFFISLDRFFKSLALYIGPDKKISLIGNFFHFNFTTNYYIAFSLPLSGEILNWIIIIIIILLLYFWLILIKEQRINLAGFLTFLIFGAISNIYDRILHGFVIDYFDLRFFTVFNLADAMIVIVVFYFIFYSIAKEKKEGNRVTTAT